MKRVVTIGNFDLLSKENIKFLITAKKYAMPDGQFIVLVRDDFSIFELTGSFPVHNLEQRMKNVKYFVRDVMFTFEFNGLSTLKELAESSKAKGELITFITHKADEKFGITPDFLRSIHMPYKIIK